MNADTADTKSQTPQAASQAPQDQADPMDVGRLVSEQAVLTIHTREAMLLFWGKDDGDDKYPIPGARHASGALRQLFALTAKDNPYADHALVKVDLLVDLIKQLISDMRRVYIQKLDHLADMGMSYSIVKAQTPKEVNLGFYSPYGYMLSTIIIMFDEFVRVLKTAERRDLISKKELHDKLYSVKHEIRRLYAYASQAQRTLCNERMRQLSRSDFLPDCQDTDAPKRISAAKQILGQLPEAIYTGKTSPRHTMRKERLSAAEQRVLDQVAAQLEEVTEGTGASDLVE
jgi:integrating conjugative element protein (TIGR03761 family)